MDAFGRLLDRFGSPMYVYQLERAERALADLRAALPQPARLYYSVKANPHPDLIRALHSAGCSVEVSSQGELAAVAAAGAPPTACLYTGPAKTGAELEAALRGGVPLFSVESATDLARVSHAAVAVGVPTRCLLRVNAPAPAATGLRMTGVDSQFGTEVAALLAGRPWRAATPGVEVVGAHFFPMSNARDEPSLFAQFQTSVAAAGQLRAAGLPMSVVDLGGGFAAPYAAPGERPRYPSLRGELEAALDTHLAGWRQGRPEVAFESGRYLVGDCGSLVCTVMEHKGQFVLLDSGINHLGGMGGLGRLLRPAAAPEPTSTSTAEDLVRATIVGPLCTPADVLGRDVPVPRVFPGMSVVFPNVGAYGLTASLLGFLSRPAPAELVLRGDRVVSATRLRWDRSDL
jgi:diaminopimelate decarboxylase